MGLSQTLSNMTVASPSGPGSAQNVLNRLFLASGPLRSVTRTSSTLTPAAATVLTATTNNRRPRPSIPKSSYSSFFPFTSPHLSFSTSMASSSHQSTASSEIATPRSQSSTTSSPRLANSNPMSSVDLTKIEQQIKMAALDQHRGYVQDHYQEVKQERSPEYVDENNAAGYQIVREPLWNKGKSINPVSSLQQHMLLIS